MNAGDLDRRITLLRRETTETPSGREEVSYVPLAKAWAKWQPLRGTQRWVAQQVVDTAEGSYLIRYREGITPLHAVEDGGVRYRIEGVPEEVGRREGLRLHVSRRFDDEV